MSVKARILRLLKQTDKLINAVTYKLIAKSEVRAEMEQDKKVLYIYFDI